MNNKIILGKWEDNVSLIPDGSVSLVLTDPPYQCTPNSWDIRPDWNNFMKEMARVCGDDGQMWIFSRMPWGLDLYSSAISAGFRWIQEVIWEKQNAGGCTVGTFRKVHENIWHFKRPDAKTFNLLSIRTPKTTKGNKSVKKRGNSDTQFLGTDNSGYIDDGLRLPRSVLQCRNVHRTKEAIGHPTQKPLVLIKTLIQYSSNEGDLVFDPFSGSGTTPFASKCLNRRWIAFEGHNECYLKSKERMKSLPS